MTTRAPTSSPPSKRIKLELDEPSLVEERDVVKVEEDHTPGQDEDENEDGDGDRCSICLQATVDRTIIPTCSHEFCFECLLVWTGTSFI